MGLTTSLMSYSASSSSGHKNTQIKGLELVSSCSRLKILRIRLIFTCWTLTSFSSVQSPLKGFDVRPVSSHLIKPLSSLASNPFKGWGQVWLYCMMGLYPPLESGETHRMWLKWDSVSKKERNFRASMYKKYRCRRNWHRAFGDQCGLGRFWRWTPVNNHCGACRPLPSSRGDCVWIAGDRREIGRPDASSKGQETWFDPWPGRVIAKHNRRPHFSCPERRQNYRRGISSDPLWSWQVQPDEDRNLWASGPKLVRRWKKPDYFSVRETKRWWQPAPSCWKKFKVESALPPEYFLLASLKRPKAGRLSMRIFWRRRTGAGRPDGPI